MGTRAAIYSRISDDRTGTEAGVGRQQEDARRLCAARGWEVVAELVDNDLSASRYARSARPGYAELVALVESGQVDAIAAYHTDRLYRQPKELEALIDLVEDRRLLVGTCEGDFDLSTSDGRAMARVVVAMAAKESDDKARRIRRKHLQLAEEGQVSGGGLRPFGYEQDRMTVRESEAALVREAAARILAGDSLWSIRQEWTAAGVATVTGAPWSTTTLRRLLCSARIAGQRTHHGRIVAEAAWPALIDRDTAVRLRAVLSDPARHRAVAARSYLLAGLVVCGRCATPMKSHPHKAGPRYACSAERGGCGRCGIAAGPLERDVHLAVLALARSRKAAARRAARRVVDDEARLVDAVAAADAELAGLADDLAAGRLGRAAFAAASVAIERRLDADRSALSRLRARRSGLALVGSDDPVATWEAMSFDRRRAAVAELVEAIVVAPTGRGAWRYDWSRVEIDWRV